MRVTFIVFNEEICGDGTRILAAILRDRGHRVRIISAPSIGSHPISTSEEEFGEVFGDTDAFCISFMSPYLPWGIHVTEFLKKTYPDKPVIWGGVHPSAMPEDSMNYVDYVGRMECDTALPEFIERLEEGKDVSDVKNFWVRDKHGTIHKNPLRPTVENLDSLPPPAYDLDSEFVLHEGKLSPLSPQLLERYHTRHYFGVPTYLAFTTRGCPFYCAYCYNSLKLAAYNTHKLRFSNLERVIHEEIKPALDRFPFFQAVGFSDDDFFFIKPKMMREFCDIWKKEVGLPFGVTTSPTSCKPDKLEMLVDAGMKVVQMGVQSGSEALNKEVNLRMSNNKKILQALDLLNRYIEAGKINVYSDFIIDNPYESDDDILESIKLYRKFPRDVWISQFSLVFYPGTALYDKALKDGLIDGGHDHFTKGFNVLEGRSHRYLTHVFMLDYATRGKLPDFLVNALTSKPARFIGNHMPKWFMDDIWGDRIVPKIRHFNFKTN